MLCSALVDGGDDNYTESRRICIVPTLEHN